MVSLVEIQIPQIAIELYTLMFLFAVGSMTGWVIELLFRRFFSAKRWINPGFLTGPCLPLYGFGVDLLYLMCKIDLSFLNNKVLELIVLVIIMTFVITLLEYIAGLIFIKGMKIKLWDYSNRWGNLQGIVCPLFTVFWAVACLLYKLLINENIVKMANWFQTNVAVVSLFVGIFIGIFMVDFVKSADLATKITKMAKDYELVVKWEEFKESISEHMDEIKAKRPKFLKPFNSQVSLKESFDRYVSITKEKLKGLAEKIKEDTK